MKTAFSKINYDLFNIICIDNEGCQGGHSKGYVALCSVHYPMNYHDKQYM